MSFFFYKLNSLFNYYSAFQRYFVPFRNSNCIIISCNPCCNPSGFITLFMNDQVASPVSQSSDVNYEEESVINLLQTLVIVTSIISLVETVAAWHILHQPTNRSKTNKTLILPLLFLTCSYRYMVLHRGLVFARQEDTSYFVLRTNQPSQVAVANCIFSVMAWFFLDKSQRCGTPFK